jgi:hypothetical protein
MPSLYIQPDLYTTGMVSGYGGLKGRFAVCGYVYAGPTHKIVYEMKFSCGKRDEEKYRQITQQHLNRKVKEFLGREH